MVDVVYVAEYESRSFSFLAVGASEAQARAAMLEGARQHTRQAVAVRSGGELDAAVRDWFSPDGVNVYAVPLGGCVRDGSLIVGELGREGGA
jgi:hypothetical protein